MAAGWGCYTEALIHRLVLENLKHRPVRTLLSAIAIGVQVTMILTLVGVSEGVLGDIAAHSRGTGADILVRPRLPTALISTIRSCWVMCIPVSIQATLTAPLWAR